MSRSQSPEEKLRGNFKCYLLKIAVNKADALLTEGEVLKAFDLAVQKMKLTSLEVEMLAPKANQLEKSKIDVSPFVGFEAGLDLLNELAEWETANVEETDERYASAKAREFLEKYGWVKK